MTEHRDFPRAGSLKPQAPALSYGNRKISLANVYQWMGRHRHSHRHLYHKHGFCRCRSGLALFAVRKGKRRRTDADLRRACIRPCVFRRAAEGANGGQGEPKSAGITGGHAAQYSRWKVLHGQFLLRLRRPRSPGVLGSNGLPLGGRSVPGAAGLVSPFYGDPAGFCGAQTDACGRLFRVVVGLLLPIISLIAERALLKVSQKRKR